MILDSDIIKEGDEEKNFEGIPEYEGGVGVNKVHAESNDILKRVGKKAMQNGDNVVFPLVGGDYDSTLQRIQEFIRAGYNVTLVYNDLPPQKAFERNINRFRKTHRLVPPFILLNYDNKPFLNFLLLRNLKGVTNNEIYNSDVAIGQKAEKIDDGRSKEDVGRRSSGTIGDGTARTGNMEGFRGLLPESGGRNSGEESREKYARQITSNSQSSNGEFLRYVRDRLSEIKRNHPQRYFYENGRWVERLSLV